MTGRVSEDLAEPLPACYRLREDLCSSPKLVALGMERALIIWVRSALGLRFPGQRLGPCFIELLSALELILSRQYSCGRCSQQESSKGVSLPTRLARARQSHRLAANFCLIGI